MRFYQGQQLNAVVQDDRQTQILYNLDQPLGQQQTGDTAQTLLLMTDANNSVLGESQQRDLRTAVYSAYGERHSDDALQSLLAFNGEVRDQASGWYLLGRGYRAYNPCLMRFHSPDSLSPFGSGGVNPYTYCLGNPIALRDPTGHEAIGWSGRLRRPDEDQTPSLSAGGGGDWLAWVFVGVGALFTVGASVAAYKSVVVATKLAGKALISAAIGAALLVTSATLTAASTVASGYAAATGDEEANKWAGYLGIGAVATAAPRIIQSAFKGVKWIYKRAFAKTAKLDSYRHGTIPRVSTPAQPAAPAAPPPIARAPIAQAPIAQAPIVPPSLVQPAANLSDIQQGLSNLKPAPPPPSGPKPGGLVDPHMMQIRDATSALNGNVKAAAGKANTNLQALIDDLEKGSPVRET
ncbi:RHS repeat-associated core domain-containing protein [Pseudomonas sp. A-R-26]|uniref:RHS repeat-associated core domain-containing protein n=1 Tax=Pseudomonas sp. A-R-26 TaxID=2832404 RepID=UPI001CBB9172|nr:RHS repeat-associated core domain-containing protein [Pseudomonas sp. A-R-26]